MNIFTPGPYNFEQSVPIFTTETLRTLREPQLKLRELSDLVVTLGAKKTLIIFALLALLLSACNSPSAASPTDEAAVLNAVYTAAAQTLSAQTAAATTTPTPKPATSTPFVTATLIPTNTTAAQQYAPVSANVVSNASGCDNSAFISDVTVSDGTVFAPGEAFTKTWSFQNSGSCTWTTSYSIIFVSGSSMSGSATALTSSVSPGGQINASVDMVAPSTNGTYTGYWKLQNAAGTSFGQSVYIQIVVSSSAATVTPTPTSTDESDSTSTPTATSEATSTTAPIATSTSIPTATSTTATTATTAPTSTPVPTETPTS